MIVVFSHPSDVTQTLATALEVTRLNGSFSAIINIKTARICRLNRLIHRRELMKDSERSTAKASQRWLAYPEYWIQQVECWMLNARRSTGAVPRWLRHQRWDWISEWSHNYKSVDFINTSEEWMKNLDRNFIQAELY